MKLGTLVNNQGVLEKLYKTPLDGRRAFQLRKRLKALGEEIKVYEEARAEYIREHGTAREDGGAEISPDDREAVSAFVEYLNGMLDNDIEGPEPFFTEDDLEAMSLSVQELDQIEALGLLKGEEEEKSA